MLDRIAIFITIVILSYLMYYFMELYTDDLLELFKEYKNKGDNKMGYTDKIHSYKINNNEMSLEESMDIDKPMIPYTSTSNDSVFNNQYRAVVTKEGYLLRCRDTIKYLDQKIQECKDTINNPDTPIDSLAHYDLKKYEYIKELLTGKTISEEEADK